MNYLEQSAIISDCGRYRYSLTRRIGSGERAVLFIGLNPSTADSTIDDPTIRRCVGFAKLWGFDWLLMGNLYAFRATNPKTLSAIEDPVGLKNQDELNKMMGISELIIVAWGNNPLTIKAKEIVDLVLKQEKVKCLGQNKNGSPKHPLYLAKSTEPVYLST